MSNDDIKRTSRTDWERLDRMTDEQIDYSDIPPLDETLFGRAKLVLPAAIMLDPNVLAWFREHDRNYAERINQVLRQYIADQVA